MDPNRGKPPGHKYEESAFAMTPFLSRSDLEGFTEPTGRSLRRMEALWACVGIALLCVACGGTPSTPAPGTPSDSATPANPAPGDVARNYVDELLDIMQSHSINRARINWADFRAQVTQSAQGAQTIPDLFPSISLALGLLEDHHSFYRGAPGTGWVRNPSSPQCIAAPVTSPRVPPDIGYVHISGFSNTAPGADVAFADAIEDHVRSMDSPDLAGWIVDVRGNGGGNMWPMIAGVGSVLGEGVAGHFVPPLGDPATRWGYQGGGAFLGDNELARTTAPYTLINPAPRVAVLTDAAVASSGEAVVVAFRARPNTRSFGSPTCGLSTANQRYHLSDGGMLFLTVAVMADRAFTPYGESLIPDELAPGDEEIVESAITWLRR